MKKIIVSDHVLQDTRGIASLCKYGLSSCPMHDGTEKWKVHAFSYAKGKKRDATEYSDEIVGTWKALVANRFYSNYGDFNYLCCCLDRDKICQVFKTEVLRE